MHRFVRSVAASAVLAVGLAVPASAAAPEVIWIPAVEFDDPFVCAGDPVIHVTYTAPFKLVIWQDRNGNVVRDATFSPGARVVLTDASTGRSLSGSSPAIFRTDYGDNGSIVSLTVNGLNAAIAVPGDGIILLDTGTITWAGGFQGPLLEDRGSHSWLGPDDASAFCGYFAG